MISEQEQARITAAQAAGFTHVGAVARETLLLRPEVRDMCAADRCGAYGKTWQCPPGCGTLEELTARMAPYGDGVVVQTVGMLEDDYDYPSMQHIMQEHKACFAAYVAALREAGENVFPLGAGGCTLCAACTYPDAPCRFPDRTWPSMEAAGLWVSEVCTQAGLAYNYGPLHMAYTSLVLFLR